MERGAVTVMRSQDFQAGGNPKLLDMGSSAPACPDINAHSKEDKARGRIKSIRFNIGVAFLPFYRVCLDLD